MIDVLEVDKVIKREGLRSTYYFSSYLPWHFLPQFVFDHHTEKDEIPAYVHKINNKLVLHSYVGDLRTSFAQKDLYNYKIIINTNDPNPLFGNDNYSIRQVVIKINPITNSNDQYHPGLITVVSNDNFINQYDLISHPGLIAVILFNRHISPSFLEKTIKNGLKIPNQKQILRIQLTDLDSLRKAQQDDYSRFEKNQIKKSFYDID